MTFLFEQQFECNLSLVQEFYASWDPWNKDVKVEIKGWVVTFTTNTLNDILGTPMVYSEPLKRLNIETPYKYICHLLCGNRSTARWIRYKEGGTNVSLSFVLNREAHLWPRIIYACLVHGMHMIEVTHNRVCIIYALMPKN